MCGGKFDWCPYLVDGTGKQQHDFEERKAVFPTAAGLLLAQAGVATLDEHRARSIAERNNHVERKFRRGDRTREENDFVSGKSHELPPADEYLTPENQQLVLRLVQEGRRTSFSTKLLLHSCPISAILRYPEGAQWLCEMLRNGQYSPAKLMRQMRDEPQYFVLFTSHLDRDLFLEAIQKMGKRMRQTLGFFCSNEKRRAEWADAVAQLLLKSMGVELFAAFNRLVVEARHIRKMPLSTRSQRRNRRNRLSHLREKSLAFQAQLLRNNGKWLLDHLFAEFEKLQSKAEEHLLVAA